MTRETDYAAIDVPDDEPAENWHYTTRRADILRRVREAGHPSAINQAALADRYGVGSSTVGDDMSALNDYLTDHRPDDRDLELSPTKDRVIRGLLAAGSGEDGDWRALEKAWKVAKEWDEWVSDREDVEALRERLDEIEAALDRRDRESQDRDREAERRWRERHR